MLRLFQGKKDQDSKSQPKKIPTPCEIRVQKGIITCSSNIYTFVLDISELNLPRNMSMKFQNSDNLLSFQVSIIPEEGNIVYSLYKYSIY